MERKRVRCNCGAELMPMPDVDGWQCAGCGRIRSGVEVAIADAQHSDDPALD